MKSQKAEQTTKDAIKKQKSNKKGVGAIHGTDLLPQAADRFFI